MPSSQAITRKIADPQLLPKILASENKSLVKGYQGTQPRRRTRYIIMDFYFRVWHKG
jgi:hypothetical protein